MPRRAIRCGGRPVISSPARKTRPALGARSPESRLMSVVLPAPLGPITAWISPSSSSSESWSTAARPPKRFESASTRSSGSAIARPPRRRQEPAQALGQRQDRDDDEEPHRQQPVLGEVAQELLHQGERE